MNKKLQLGMTLAAFISNNAEDCAEESTPLWKDMRDASRAQAIDRGLLIIRDEEEHLIIETKTYDDVRAIIVAYEAVFCLGQCTTVEAPEDDEIENMLEATELYSTHDDAHDHAGAAGKMPIYLVY